MPDINIAIACLALGLGAALVGLLSVGSILQAEIENLEKRIRILEDKETRLRAVIKAERSDR